MRIGVNHDLSFFANAGNYRQCRMLRSCFAYRSCVPVNILKCSRQLARSSTNTTAQRPSLLWFGGRFFSTFRCRLSFRSGMPRGGPFGRSLVRRFATSITTTSTTLPPLVLHARSLVAPLPAVVLNRKGKLVAFRPPVEVTGSKSTFAMSQHLSTYRRSVDRSAAGTASPPNPALQPPRPSALGGSPMFRVPRIVEHASAVPRRSTSACGGSRRVPSSRSPTIAYVRNWQQQRRRQ